MSQHDYTIADATGAAFLADLNLALPALVSNSSVATEPATMFAYMLWADTTSGILKQRNAANSAWIDVLTLATGVVLQPVATATTVSTTVASGAVGTTQSANDNSTKVATTAYADRGRLTQVVTSATGEVATGTTVLPFDDTIPQNTEGDQYLTATITPKNAASQLEIDVSVTIASTQGVGYALIAALFQDATANALAVNYTLQDTASGWPHIITFKHIITAGTTSATTFNVRAGGSTAATTTLNGSGGTRVFGGVLSSRITIKEYLP